MKDKRGQVLIELVWVLPILLALICGVVDFGRAIYTKSALNNAARSGARAAAVTPNLRGASPASLASFPNGEPADTIKKCIEGIIFNKKADIAYELKVFNADGSSNTGDAVPGNRVDVIITWNDFDMITQPLLNRVVALASDTTPKDSEVLTITGEASMRYE